MDEPGQATTPIRTREHARLAGLLRRYSSWTMATRRGPLGCLALVVVAAACGEVKATPDGGGDGGGGAGDGASAGEATLELQLGGVATAGKNVVFSNPDGTLASEATTDASGVARGTVQTGAMITIAIAAGDLVTIAGVKPGDHIVFKNPPPSDTTSAGLVSFAAASEATNKSYYRVDLGGDDYLTVQDMTSGTRTLDLPRANLDAAGKIQVAAGVYDAADRLIAYTFLANVTPILGQTTAVTFPDYKTDVVDLDVTLSGAPVDATQLTVDSANEQAGLPYLPSGFAGLDRSSVSGGGATVVVPYLGSFGDAVQTSAHLTFSTATESFTWTRRVPRPAGAYAIGAADMPPRLGVAAVDASTSTRPKLTWTIDGDAARGDGILVELSWRNGASDMFAWHAYLPPDATTITFPVVSSAIAPQAPNDTSFLGSVRVSHHDLEPLGGFDAFRTAPPIDFANPVLPAGFTSWVESEAHKTL